MPSSKHQTSSSFPLGLLRIRVAQVLADLIIFSVALIGAYLTRFEGDIPDRALAQMVSMLPYVVLARFLVSTATGMYRIVWRYIGMREAIRFAQSVAVVSAVLLLVRLLDLGTSSAQLPVGIIILEGIFSFFGTAGVRFVRRIQYERRRTEHRSRHVDRPPCPTLLIGAGESGLSITKEAQRSLNLGIRIIGFLDDDTAKSGMDLHGVRVLGPVSTLAEILLKGEVQQVFITTARIPSETIRDIVEQCRAANIDVRIVPALYEILGSTLDLSMMREVRIEDLLSRDPIPPSLHVDELRSHYEGKTLLVTGAGGSIGSELCRQLALMRPERLLLLERDENNLFQIDRELARLARNIERIPLLVDICEKRPMERVFRTYKPQAVFHAAAYKHVPMMELFAASAARNNILGTRQLLELATDCGTETFVFISTDKAVNPTSVMGATKRFAELLVQNTATTNTNFSCVRFGNVLGSRGSVVGIFKEQIRRGGPVTVTHKDATRYFMTVQEAVNLVLQAGTLASRGSVFLLDMGKPVQILELARQMIRLSGYSEAEIPVEITGFRPGEKLFEELRLQTDDVVATALRKIYRVTPSQRAASVLDGFVERLQFLVKNNSHEGVRELLHELEIGYHYADAVDSDIAR